MSYDLVFWKQTSCCNDTPSKVCEALLNGETPTGLQEIPIREMLTRVRDAFPGITEDGGMVFWEGGDHGMFEISFSPVHVHFCCRQLEAVSTNRLIEIAHEFECPLYDPQVDKQFTG